MFTKILLPTDGSPLGNASELAGVEMAKSLGAEVVGVFVARELQNPMFDFSDRRPSITMPSQEEFKNAVKMAGEDYLKPLKEAAEKAGIPFTGIIKISNATGKTIVETAKEAGCDLIFIGSHGCAGWGSKIMGSVANKVLDMSEIPTLVYHLKREHVPEEALTSSKYKPAIGV